MDGYDAPELLQVDAEALSDLARRIVLQQEPASLGLLGRFRFILRLFFGVIILR